MKTYTAREFKKLLSRNGYKSLRWNGSHEIFSNGENIISINIRPNRMVCERLIKENNLKE